MEVTYKASKTYDPETFNRSSYIDNIIQNCFFFWSHGLILILTAIPIGSYLISKMFDTPLWSVPKVYELKMYAIAMLFCMLIATLGAKYPTFFRRNFPKYQNYLLLFYPLSTTIFSLSSNVFTNYLSVFALALMGSGFLYIDVKATAHTNKSIFDKYFNILLLISISTSVLIIACFAKDLAFSIASSWTWILGIYVFILLYMRLANFNSKYFTWTIPFLLFAATFWSMSGTDVTHYGFFLGPVIESMYGHYHPLTLDAQYGGGLTSFLILYFKLLGGISLKNMQLLLQILTFAQFLLIYFVSVSIYQSKKIACLVLATIMFFSFYSINGWSYYMAPSMGFLRFGFIYLILFCYTLEENYISKKSVNWITALLGSIAFIWSFESAVYTLPALFFVEYLNKNIKKFLPIFLVCLIAVNSVYLFPFALEGEWPPLSRYYEYAMVYANGFGQISLGHFTSFWWLYPLLYGYILIRAILGTISNKIIVALAVYGLAIFTYFSGRAHPANLLAVSIPFILLTAYLILNLKFRSHFLKQILLASALIVFFSAQNVLFPGATIKIIWERNLPLIKQSFLALRGQENHASAYNTPSDIECTSPLFDPLKKYVENNSIAIISFDETIPLNFYACTKTHNALLLNPYYGTFLNPTALKRAEQRAGTFTNHFVLVDSILLSPKEQLAATPLNILKKLHAIKADEFKLGSTTFIVFQATVNT